MLDHLLDLRLPRTLHSHRALTTTEVALGEHLEGTVQQ